MHLYNFYENEDTTLKKEVQSSRWFHHLKNLLNHFFEIQWDHSQSHFNSTQTGKSMFFSINKCLQIFFYIIIAWEKGHILQTLYRIYRASCTKSYSIIQVFPLPELKLNWVFRGQAVSCFYNQKEHQFHFKLYYSVVPISDIFLL